MMMNVYEVIRFVQQIHFVGIHLDHILYVYFYGLFLKKNFVSFVFFLKCDCISGYKMLAERTFCEGK